MNRFFKARELFQIQCFQTWKFWTHLVYYNEKTINTLASRKFFCKRAGSVKSSLKWRGLEKKLRGIISCYKFSMQQIVWLYLKQNINSLVVGLTQKSIETTLKKWKLLKFCSSKTNEKKNCCGNHEHKCFV